MASTFRADIQGLRALAVALVVVFHLSPETVPGGFVGVDVFFVISGYLITAHLLREAEETGRVRLGQFWARRVRRLLPAAFVVLAASAIAAWFWIPSSLLPQNFREIALAAIYGLNWGLAADAVDYLASDNTPSLAQHYWSLSVEEQFYLIWPVLVLLALHVASKSARLSARGAVAGTLATIFVASLSFSVWLTATSPAAAYFVTTTRAWEFAAGGLVALLPTFARGQRSRIFASWVAVTMIVAAAMLYSGATPFPGWQALLPVMGTAFLLWNGDESSRWGPQYLARSGPTVFLGSISYSAYLWHWPLIVLFTTQHGRPPGWKWALGLAALTLVLATLSYHYVEEPLRRGPGILSRQRPTFAFMAVGIATVLAVALIPTQFIRAENEADIDVIDQLVTDPAGCFGAYAVINDCVDPYVMTDTVNPSVAVDDQFRISGVLHDSSVCEEKRVRTQLEVTCNLAEAEHPGHRVVLVGDSHAEHFATPFGEIAQRRGWEMSLRSRAGCSGFMDPSAATDEARAGCVAWGDELFDDLEADPDIDLVIVANRTFLYPEAQNSANAADRLSALTAAGKEVVVVRMVPGTETRWPLVAPGEKAPICVDRARSDDPCSWTPPAVDDWLVDAADASGGHVLDTRDILCADGSCHTVIGGAVVYFDENHLTTSFARTLVPWFESELDSLEF